MNISEAELQQLQTLADESGETIADLLAALKTRADTMSVSISFRIFLKDKRYLTALATEQKISLSDVFREIIKFHQENARK